MTDLLITTINAVYVFSITASLLHFIRMSNKMTNSNTMERLKSLNVGFKKFKL